MSLAATIEQMLDMAKGQIGLFIELKVIPQMRKWHKTSLKWLTNEILNQVVLISLDYNLIKYIEINFPHVQTGYLYFFAIGDLQSMYGDYLIMEEICRLLTKKSMKSRVRVKRSSYGR